ncbi:hypothetical protein [Parvularcula marina]|uniref:hypothetical protein n=1 Tax=Parvularcula marina TaxID=2292771 RepID=UPI0035192582
MTRLRILFADGLANAWRVPVALLIILSRIMRLALFLIVYAIMMIPVLLVVYSLILALPSRDPDLILPFGFLLFMAFGWGMMLMPVLRWLPPPRLLSPCFKNPYAAFGKVQILTANRKAPRISDARARQTLPQGLQTNLDSLA